MTGHHASKMLVRRLRAYGFSVNALGLIYSYLITDNGKFDSEIKRRIEIARGAFNNISKVITSTKISTSTRLRLIKCYVWSTLSYGAETWTISKTLAGRINAFEMWTYRKMLRLSYTKHKTNEEVLDMLSTEKQLLSNIVKRKFQYFGHLIRQNELQRQLLEGKIMASAAEEDQELHGWTT